MLANFVKAIFSPSQYVIVEKEEYDKLQDMACRDALTQLNRCWVFFEELDKELSRANRYGHGIAVMVIDLDDLKEHNKKGHANGDRALKAVADSIRKTIRRGDISGRMSDKGDEFAIAMPTSSNIGNVVKVANRLCDECKQLDASVTIGFAYRAKVIRRKGYSLSAIDLYSEASRMLIEGKDIKKGGVYGF